MKILKISLILIFGGAFLFYYYRFNPASENELFLSCPSKTIFGLNCPGCGSQRMVHSLLHLDFKSAFSYNPLLFVSLPFVVIIVFKFISNLLFDTQYRIKLLYKNWFIFSLFALLTVYTIVRNLTFWPYIK